MPSFRTQKIYKADTHGSCSHGIYSSIEGTEKEHGDRMCLNKGNVISEDATGLDLGLQVAVN